MVDEKDTRNEDDLWLEEGMSSPEARQSHRKVKVDHFDRTRSKVYSTGNKWVIENFNATHY